MERVDNLKRTKGIYEKCIKRILDFVLALSALIILSPVFCVVAILVRIKLGSPIIFKQERPGLHEKIFCMYKFRTMTDDKDEKGQLLPDDIRLKKFGKILRSTSLDELPELWNILRGDMSVVGPRPLLVQYLPLYSEEQRHRHDVRPGFTGLAQVNGRNSISWEEKFEWDIKYVSNITFINDLKIIMKTICVVLGRQGVSSDTSVTMEAFTGLEKEKRK